MGQIRRDLPNDEYQAAVGANNPSALNVFATIADLTSGGGIQHGVAAGTNTYTVAIPGVVSYTDGDSYAIRFTNGNDADSTININGLGAINLTKKANVQVTGGDIVDGQEMLIIYDGANFQSIQTTPNQLFAYVTNDDAVTINKGQPVYAFGAAGNRMSVKLASNTADATSAQTVGVVFSTSIAPNQRGFVITQGVIDGLDTSMYASGDQLYLGATAGSLTNVKPYAPNHLVYIGIVERVNAGSGQIYIKPQNGYELDELHDVDLISTPPINGDLLTFNSITGLWEPQAQAASPAEREIDSTYAYDMSQAAGYTWNGTTVGATGLVTLNERTRLQAFAGVGAADGCFMNTTLPSYYINDNSIRVDLVVTTGGAGGDVKYFIGLSKPVAGAFAGAAGAAWTSQIHTAAAGFPVVKISVTFSGVGLLQGDPIGILVYRDPGDPQDTFTGDSYLNTIQVEQL